MPNFQKIKEAFNRHLELEMWIYKRLTESTISGALSLWIQILEVNLLGRTDVAGCIPSPLHPQKDSTMHPIPPSFPTG